MGRSGATAAAARWHQAQEGAWGQDPNDRLAPGVRTPPPGAPENLLGRFLKVQTQDLPKRVSVARRQGGPRAWPDKQVHPVPGEENAQEGSQVLGGCLQAARTPGPPPHLPPALAARLALTGDTQDKGQLSAAKTILSSLVRHPRAA